MPTNATVQIGRGSGAVRFGADLPLALFAGPCQLESRAHALEMAGAERFDFGVPDDFLRSVQAFRQTP